MYWLMIFSFIIGFLLSVMPLPNEYQVWRPEFIALLVIYWATYSPQYFGVFMAFCMGLLLDTLELLPLGYNSIGLVIIAYIAHLTYRRVRGYTIWQQALWVFILTGIYSLFCSWVSGFLIKPIPPKEYVVASLLTAIIWPLFAVTMKRLRIYYRIPI